MRPDRLVLHVGMPKAASSALQIWADANRAALLAQGVHYPPSTGARFDPKHQILVTMMIRNQLNDLPAFIDAAQAPTLFLSTEGLTYHFQDYRPVTLERFRDIVKGIRVTILMLVRDAEAWLRSQYKQAVINPPVANAGYACALSLEDFARTDRIRRLLDRDQLLADMRAGYGAEEAVTVQIETGWTDAVAETLGVRLGPEFTAPVQANESVPDDLIALIRQVNAMELPVDIRQAVLALCQVSEKTRHNMMRSYLSRVSGQVVHKAEIGDCLRRLIAKTDAQSAVLERMQCTLSAAGDHWA
jgi:hypothetical protein